MSLRRNLIFSSILTVSNFLFPFLVYPYVARVLGPNNIGICNFVDSIINYAMLISMMGITIIGTRNIAKAKDNQVELNKTFTAMFFLAGCFTVISTLILIFVTYFVEALASYKSLLLIGIIKLWSNFLLIEWLYKGLEDFRYITVRTIAVKLLFVVSVFVFIHTANDYIIYFLLLCLMVALNAAYNCYRASRLIHFSFDWTYIRAFFASFIMLGIYLLLNSMYTTFNVTYLGLVSGDVEVGYYTTATKIFKIILAFYTAYTTVLLPRASSLLAQGKENEFKNLVKISVNGMMMISVPIALFCMLFSPGIVLLIAGEAYQGAILPMVIVMPLMFIIGYEQILVVQILTPRANDRVILFNSIIGATVGILGNILIVNYFQCVGSAIVWILAEIAVLLSSQYFVKKYTGITFPWHELGKNLFAYLPFVLLSLVCIWLCKDKVLISMFIGLIFTGVYFMFIQRVYLKNPILRQILLSINNKLKPNR